MKPESDSMTQTPRDKEGSIISQKLCIKFPDMEYVVYLNGVRAWSLTRLWDVLNNKIEIMDAFAPRVLPFKAEAGGGSNYRFGKSGNTGC